MKYECMPNINAQDHILQFFVVSVRRHEERNEMPNQITMPKSLIVDKKMSGVIN